MDAPRFSCYPDALVGELAKEGPVKVGIQGPLIDQPVSQIGPGPVEENPAIKKVRGQKIIGTGPPGRSIDDLDPSGPDPFQGPEAEVGEALVRPKEGVIQVGDYQLDGLA